jgi:hypothetical protein
MFIMNQQSESQLYEQMAHESLTTLTIVSARLQLLRRRIEANNDVEALPVERSLREAERLISERAGRIHVLAAKLSSRSPDTHPLKR